MFQWSSDGGENIITAGDFPVFYSAGFVALSNPESIYDLDIQSSLQQKFWKSEEGGFHVFAYPPWVAIALIPFSILAPLLSKFIFITISIWLSFLSASRLREYCSIPLSGTSALAFLLLIPPYASGVLGGQNSAFSLFVFLAMLSAQKDKRYYLVGVLIAIWNFKPQYSVLALFFLLLLDNSVVATGRLKIVTGYVVFTLIEVSISFLYFGPNIFNKWFEMMKTLALLNQGSTANVSRMISLPSFGQYLIGTLGAWTIVPLIFLVAYCIMYPAFLASRLSSFMGPIIGLFVVLFSPQTGHYDIALTVPFFLHVMRAQEISPVVWKFLLSCLILLLAMIFQFKSSVPVLTMLLVLASVVGLRKIALLTNP